MPLLSTRGAASVRGFGFGAAAGDAYWIANLFNSGQGTDIATDSQGNLVATGYASGPGAVLAHTEKYDKDGVIQWQRRLGGTSNNGGYGYAVTIDSSGNYIVSGLSAITQYTITRYNFFVAKYDSSGALQWQQILGTNDQQTYTGYGLTTDSSNNIYVFSEYGQFVKFDQYGNLQWQNMLYSLSVLPRDLTIDSDGFLYLLAYGGPTGSSANEAVFVIKTNSSGTIQWQRRIAPSENGYRAYGIACDSSNNVYISGLRSDAPNQPAMTMTKMNSSGTTQWSSSLIGVSEVGRCAVDSSGNSYLIGTGYNGSRNEIVFAKYNTSGTLQWQRLLDIPSSDARGWGVALTPSGALCITGYAPYDYTLIMKVPSDGSKTGTYSLRGRSFVYDVSSRTTTTPSFTTSASSGNIYSIGYSLSSNSLTSASTSNSSATVPI